MKVLSVVALKGGAGKSMLVASLSVAFESLGVSVVVIDLDPQESVTQWAKARGDKPPIVVSGLVERLPHMLTKARESEVPLVLIDTPPHTDKNAVGAAAVSDLILVPLRPSGFDVRSFVKTVDVLKLAGRLDRSYVVINHSPPVGGQADEAETIAKSHGLQIAPARIPFRAALGHAITANKGVTEYDPQSKAAAEIATLRAFVMGKLDLKKR